MKNRIKLMPNVTILRRESGVDIYNGADGVFIKGKHAYEIIEAIANLVEYDTKVIESEKVSHICDALVHKGFAYEIKFEESSKNRQTNTYIHTLAERKSISTEKLLSLVTSSVHINLPRYLAISLCKSLVHLNVKNIDCKFNNEDLRRLNDYFDMLHTQPNMNIDFIPKIDELADYGAVFISESKLISEYGADNWPKIMKLNVPKYLFFFRGRKCFSLAFSSTDRNDASLKSIIEMAQKELGLTPSYENENQLECVPASLIAHRVTIDFFNRSLFARHVSSTNIHVIDMLEYEIIQINNIQTLNYKPRINSSS